MAEAILAAHTFDFTRVYLASRDDAVPGSGTWTIIQTLFDGFQYPDHAELFTFSAGALSAGDDFGIVGETDLGLTYIGNGLPAAPQLFNVPSLAGHTFFDLDYFNTSDGSWTYGGAKYCLVDDHPPFGFDTITLLKTTDGGASFVPMTGGIGPPAINVHDGMVQRVGNKLFVFAATDNPGTMFAIYPYNLVTDEWEASFAAVTLANFSEFEDANAQWTNNFIQFPNGDWAIFFNTPSPTKQCIAKIWTLLTDSWSSDIVMPGSICAQDLLGPDNETIHAISYENSANHLRGPVYYSTLAHDGTVTGPIATIPGVSDSVDGVQHSSIQNGKIFVPRDDLSSHTNSVWVANLLGTFSEELLPIPADEKNVIRLAAINGGGINYVVGDTGTINGGLDLAEYRVTGVNTGVINGYALDAQGSGYAVNDTGAVNGTIPANYLILAVDGMGGVTDFVLESLGSGFTVGTGKATTPSSGGGTGFTIDVTSVFNGVYSAVITFNGSGYGVANNIATTTGGDQPGVGTGLTFNILQVGFKTPSTAYMMYPNGYFFSTPPPYGPQPALACPIVNTGTVGKPFSAQLQVSGGTPPYTFSVVS